MRKVQISITAFNHQRLSISESCFFNSAISIYKGLGYLQSHLSNIVVESNGFWIKLTTPSPLAFVFCSAFISADINATGIDKKEFWRFIVKKSRPIEYCINSGGIKK